MPRILFGVVKKINNYSDQSLQYRNFCPDDQLHIICPHCHALVLLCEKLPKDTKRKISQLRKKGMFRETIQIICEEVPCAFGEAKSILFHIPFANSECHHCGANMRKGSLLCPNCMSVNLDW